MFDSFVTYLRFHYHRFGWASPSFAFAFLPSITCNRFRLCFETMACSVSALCFQGLFCWDVTGISLSNIIIYYPPTADSFTNNHWARSKEDIGFELNLLTVLSCWNVDLQPFPVLRFVSSFWSFTQIDRTWSLIRRILPD